MKEYTRDELAKQPPGYWTGEAYRTIVGRIRAELGVEDLTQPHWWTLNHVAGSPGTWTRAKLAEKLAPYDDQGLDFDAVFDDLVSRGWMTEDEGFVLTEEGEDGRLRARDRAARSHKQTFEGIDTAEYAAALNVLRRMIDNLGGDSDLP
jgi:hypothetical protein